MTSQTAMELEDDDQRVIDALMDEEPGSECGATRWETVLTRGRQLGITDRFIKECRLAGSRPAMRNCVSCDERFLSTGFHNRLCRRCRPR